MSRLVRLVTGPTHSGKTTRLLAWSQGRTDVRGVVAPDGPGGRRMLDLGSGEQVEMEGPGLTEARLEIGPYRFRKAAFDWAGERLRAAAVDPEATFLVVDEIGPLELRGEGLASALDALAAEPDGPQWIVVVRESLLDPVAARFDLRYAVFPPD